MNGKGHALTATLGWFAAAPLAAQALHHPIGRWELAAGGLVAAGAGMLPDIDHPGATAARTFGPFGRAVAKAVSKVARGHRGRTHRISFAITAGLGTAWSASHWSWGAAVVTAVVAAWAWRQLGPDLRLEVIRCDVDAIVAGTAAGVATFVWLTPGWWLPAAVAAGALVHLAGDRLFGNRLVRVDGPIERVVVWALSMALPVVVLVQCGVLIPAP